MLGDEEFEVYLGHVYFRKSIYKDFTVVRRFFVIIYFNKCFGRVGFVLCWKTDLDLVVYG